MPKSCSVRACRSRVRRGVYLNRFFQFPSDPERRRLWASRCGNGDAWMPSSKHVYVCADHFVTGEPLNNRGHPDYAPSLLLGVDDVNKHKDVDSITEAPTRPKEAESIREIIKYDEYFEGGIPDSLLEGLGFSETDKPAEEDEEEIEMDSVTTAVDVAPVCHADVAALVAPDVAHLGHMDVAKMLQFGLMTGLILPAPAFFPVLSAPSLASPLNTSLIAVQSEVAQQNEVLNLAISQNKPSYSNAGNGAQSHVAHPSTSPLDLTAKHEVARPTTVSNKSSPVNRAKRMPSSLNPTGRLETPHMKSHRQSATQSILSESEPGHSWDGRSSTTRQITKGNIMYERLPSGEVVASVIKKPDVQDLSSKVDSKLKKTQPRVVQSTNVRHNQISISNLEQCPSEYPVTEHNIMDVLEQSIQATHSMRLLLMTLRDDLRRTGGSNSSVVTGEQARKRREVAIKLSTAYATYKESIDNIENARFLGGSAAESKPKPMVSNVITPESCTSTASGSISNRLKQAACGGNTDHQTSSSNYFGKSSTRSNVTCERVDEKSSGCSAMRAPGECDEDLLLSESRIDKLPSSLHIDET